jgi:hypothetical protein
LEPVLFGGLSFPVSPSPPFRRQSKASRKS